MARRVLLVCALFAASAVPASAQNAGDFRLDAALRERARAPQGTTSRVIIQTVDGSPADTLIRSVGGTPGRRLPLLRGQVAEIPDIALAELAGRPAVSAISLDRHVRGTMERTATTIGAAWVQDTIGFDGAGIGVAILDSGVTSWHDDLGSERVVHFADFVNQQSSAYDDYGHGTHVAGIIAGNGYDSGGARRGIAPGASLVVLKVLDETGDGFISNVISALNYAVQNRAQFNIRVINLSVAAAVYESYHTDPLTLAARRAVEAGIVVVTASGNLGRDGEGRARYGGITAPGNAPWVLTVGAVSHNGTVSRADDTVAPFSSRGPGAIDGSAKPDIVAPGVGIESITDRSTTLFRSRPGARLWGIVDTAAQPYLSLSGTSMSAPVVAGTIALMLQANPSLSPNLVKAILQYTAEERGGYDHLTQGAGFLNARGAVQLAQLLAGTIVEPDAADPTPWSRRLIWGNQRLGGGELAIDANAWRLDVMWGATHAQDGTAIMWGTSFVLDDIQDQDDQRDEAIEDPVMWRPEAA
jgi:serine protease AprX